MQDVSVDDLLRRRAEQIATGDLQGARRATSQLAAALGREGRQGEAIGLNQELLGIEEHPLPLNAIGRSYSDLGDLRESRMWYERALAAARGRVPLEEATAWHQLGVLDYRMGDPRAAREKLMRSYTIKCEHGTTASQSKSLHLIAEIDLELGDALMARDELRRTIELYRQMDEAPRQARAWYDLGRAELRLGALDQAATSFRRALSLFTSEHDVAQEARCWYYLGRVARRLGHKGVATRAHRRSMEAAERAGAQSTIADNLYALGHNYLDDGKPVQAYHAYVRCAHLRHDLARRSGEASAWREAARAANRANRLHDQHVALHRAGTLFDELNDEGAAAIWQELAALDIAEGQLEAAHANLQRAATAFRRGGSPAGEAGTLWALAKLDMQQDRIDDAYEVLVRAEPLFAKADDESGRMLVLQHMGAIELSRGELEMGRGRLHRVLRYAQEQGSELDQGMILWQLAQADLNQDRPEDARQRAEQALSLFLRGGGAPEERHCHDLLATIDYESGDYMSAREHLEACLPIDRQVGDDVAEASRFLSMAIMAAHDQLYEEALRLSALSFVLYKPTDHEDTERAFHTLVGLSSRLRRTQSDLDVLMEDVTRAYEFDGGHAMLRLCFG